MLSTKLTYALAILAGLFIGFVGPEILGYTSAIPWPDGYFSWLQDWPALRAYLWEWLVVQLPAYGLLGALATGLVIRAGDAGWPTLCLLVLLAELTVPLWIHPQLSGQTIPGTLLAEWLLLHLAALVPAILLAGLIEGRRV